MSFEPLAALLSRLAPTEDWTPALADLSALNIDDELELAFTALSLTKPISLKAQQLVLKHLSAGGSLASDLAAKERPGALSANVQVIDHILHVKPGDLVEISGSTCKTLLALTYALQLLLDDTMAHALYVDVSATFNPDRAFAVLRHLASASVKEDVASLRDADLARYLDRLTIVRCTGVKEIMKNMDQLKAIATSRNCLVIDSLTPIYKDRLISAPTQTNASMVAFLRHLRIFAEETASAVLLVNDTVKAQSAPLSAFGACSIRPALGFSVSFLCDTTVFLHKASEVLSGANLKGSSDKVIALDIWRQRGHVTAFTFFSTNGIYVKQVTPMQC